MTTTTLQPPIISAADLARRWGKHESTITEWVRRGIIIPVLRAGRSRVFAMADVLRIEAGHALQEDDTVTIKPLTWEGRTSPVVLRQRVELAAQVLDVTQYCQSRLGGVAVEKSAVDAIRLAAAAIRCQASGGDSARLPEPLFGPSESRGIAYTDSDAPPILSAMAYAALAHCLTSNEQRVALHDLGPLSKRLMFETLNRLEVAIDAVMTDD